ncbi:hypothetical protein AMELA_G00049960, partial [Ameiurus melas]
SSEDSAKAASVFRSAQQSAKRLHVNTDFRVKLFHERPSICWLFRKAERLAQSSQGRQIVVEIRQH